ncbi:MAG TPA: ABC transporter transmembrane domain-containing protein, partial [Gemmatimonadaceae bacterium]
MPSLRDRSASGSDDLLPLTAVRALFADGEPRAGGSDKPFPLDDDSVFLVEQGDVDVFSVGLAGAPRPGGRTHLFRVAAGEALFALGPAGPGVTRRLLAVGTSGARVRRTDAPRLRARQGVHAQTMHALVDRWVETVCAGMVRGMVPKVCAEMDVGTEVRVAGPTVARARRGVAWIRHAEGHSLLFGQDSLKVNGVGYVPLSSRAWLRVNEASRIVLVETAALPDAGALWQGLAHLHTLVLRYAALLEAQAIDTTAARLRRKEAGHRAALREACGSLVGAMRSARDVSPAGTPADAGLEAHAEEHAALVAACRLVGHALGVTVRSFPKPEDGSYPRDPIAAIARASRLRSRAVMLRDEWWRHDNGPLLASLEHEDGRAVALLRERNAYVVHDSRHGTRTRVDAAVAETLRPVAHAFYRPFPDKALSIADVVRAGARGCRRDLAMVLAMGVLAALLGLIPAMATGQIFNSIIPGAQRSQLVQLSVILVACACSTALFNLVRGIALLRIETRMSVAIQAAVWDRLLSLPMPFFRLFPAGDLALRAMGIDAIRQVISGTTISAILGGVFSLFNFALMFSYSSTMAWRATLLIAAAMVVTVLGSWLQLGHQRGIAAIQSKTSGLVLQLLSSIAKLRVAGAEVTAFTLWARRFAQQRQLEYRARKIGNTVGAFNAAFPTLAFMLLFWTALPLIHGAQATMRTGDFLAFLAAYGGCQGALLGTCTAL